MKEAFLHLPSEVHDNVWRHLLRNPPNAEEVAFIYVRSMKGDGDQVFRYLSWEPVPPEGFMSRSEYHFELTDEMKGSVIKRAHDLRSSIVELHSHISDWHAQFSYSDLMGFREFVPHVLWRLKGHPYLALVVTRSGFDGFVWSDDPKAPSRLGGILVNGSLLKPSGISPKSVDLNYE